jgi:hypothetical protein
MISEIKANYQATFDQYRKLNQQSIRLSKMISIFRLFVFLLVIFLVYLFAINHAVPSLIVSLVLGAAVFISLMKIHSRILIKIKLQEAIIKINQDEILALDGKYDFFENGTEFNDPAHPFSEDLDIFGEGSLFQFLNRTSTKTGREKLASTLQKPYLQAEMIMANQQAIAEMKVMKDWRHDFQAIGLAYEDKKTDKEKISSWAKLPPLFGHFIYGWLVIAIPLLTLFMIILLSLDYIETKTFIYYLTLPLGIAGSFTKKFNQRHLEVSKTSEMLTKYALLIQKIESLKITAPRLVELQKQVKNDRFIASISLKKLSSVLADLDTRSNPFSWIFLNGLLLWDIMQMRRLESWQKMHRNEIEHWFEVIAETDALNCFANFAYNQPEAQFPDILTENNQIKAENLGHPLIHRDMRVNNPLYIQNSQFLIITGANMAGKSTYLRTVGLNLVLSMCGSPVCASAFSFKPVEIYTSIRTRDSLQKNESYFYSELKRLKAIIDELKTGKKLFIILDEILKGTNSKDKHAGSEALLKQLIRFNASGIVATHDVALGILQESFPDHILNRCFEVEIEGERLIFDYKLKEGVSKNMNATILMREMGITV